MSWRALRGADGSARRIGPVPEGPLRQGTLLLSFDAAALGRAYGPILRIGPRLEPQRIFALDRRRDGELSFLIRDGAEVSHIAVLPGDTGAHLHLAYLWNCDREEALLTVLSGDRGIVHRVGRGPVPAIGSDQIATLFTSRHGAFRHDAIRGMAVADHLMPIGPLPGLLAGSLVTTPEGPRSIETLRPGDLVLGAGGGPVPVLWQGGAELPALPGLGPVRLKAPFHGLDHDLVTLPDQLVAIGGRDVEYQFGAERVMVRARDLIDGTTAMEDAVRTATVHYHTILLAEPEMFLASGALVQSFTPGRLARQPALAGMSVAADWFVAGDTLRHDRSAARVLQPFEVKELRRIRDLRRAPYAV
ncbi:MAG: Hint domain-containing protein [Proteobacteria bacterium]|nr:Hint domain-containing protein [Pseudomonadota bacterium]